MTTNDNRPESVHTEIQLLSGGFFDYERVEEHEVPLNDIVRSIAKVCRFGGHCVGFYSVASHSMLVAYLADLDNHDRETILHCLMHDFGESVFTDLPSPMKKSLRGTDFLQTYTEREEAFIRRVRENLGVSEPTQEVRDIIKNYDEIALAIEMANIMSPASKRYFNQNDVDDFKIKFSAERGGLCFVGRPEYSISSVKEIASLISEGDVDVVSDELQSWMDSYISTINISKDKSEKEIKELNDGRQF